MTQDLNPVQWGAQDRFQAHFIVKTHHDVSEESFLARPKLETKGYFASKRVSGVQWIGGILADALNSDRELEKMLTKIPYEDAQIYVEPTKGGIRIHGKWKDSHNFTMTKELFAVYDRIASHIKRELGPPPVQS
jgi:coproporphyrinogen III oxidase